MLTRLTAEMEMVRVLVACVLVCSVVGAPLPLNERPIIGIVTEQYNGTHSYIAASYVKYLEAAGARVVPVLNNSTEEQAQHLFKSINGVLFPGGGVSLNKSGYAFVSGRFYQLAIEAYSDGDYFPVWGTCLGFQMISVLQAQDYSILSAVDAENYSIPLALTAEAKSSRLFSSYSSEALDWISTEDLTMNNHHWAVTTKTFSSISKLNSFFTVLSTDKDRNGVEFVSTMEAKSYPIYAVQWHPEKNIFEWTTKEGINHSEHAVVISQMAADFLVQEARKSTHRFASLEEEESTLIYNYDPTYVDSSSFEQVYIF